MEQFCAANGISDDDTFNLHLVLDESVINVIAHGYQDPSSEHEIRVRLQVNEGELVVEIDDDGIAYNPLEAPVPRFDLPVEQRRIGGLGVHIMKTLARSIEYKRDKDRNHLRIVLRLGQDASPDSV